MKSECRTIRYLRQLSSTDSTLSVAAASALNIIADIRDSAMSRADVKYLHLLVDVICRDGHEILLSHLRDGVPDCEICAALDRQFEVLRPKSAEAREEGLRGAQFQSK